MLTIIVTCTRGRWDRVGDNEKGDDEEGPSGMDMDEAHIIVQVTSISKTARTNTKRMRVISKIINSVPSPRKPSVVLEELVVMLKDVHTSDLIYGVVFPMRYFYRLASINPESDQAWMDTGSEDVQGFKDLTPIILVMDHEEDRQREDIYLIMSLRAWLRGQETGEEGRERLSRPDDD